MSTTELHDYLLLKTVFHDRMRSEILPELEAKYGDDVGFYLAILDSEGPSDWTKPFSILMLEFGTPEISYSEGSARENVERKLRFSLRTGLNSSEAKYHRHLVLPGDFPYEGAGRHRGIWGGVSGLQEEQDWWVFRRCTDMFIELYGEEIQERIDLSDRRKNPDRTVEQKYLLS